jgi:hypothetical protein
MPAKKGAGKLNRQDRDERKGRRRKALPQRTRRGDNKFNPKDGREDNAKQGNGHGSAWMDTCIYSPHQPLPNTGQGVFSPQLPHFLITPYLALSWRSFASIVVTFAPSAAFVSRRNAFLCGHRGLGGEAFLP